MQTLEKIKANSSTYACEHKHAVSLLQSLDYSSKCRSTERLSAFLTLFSTAELEVQQSMSTRMQYLFYSLWTIVASAGRQEDSVIFIFE